MIDPPRILALAAQPYAYLHLVVPVREVPKIMGPGVAEVADAIKAQGISPSGPWFTHHLRRPTEIFDFEICFPVERAIAPHDRVQPGIWPAMEVVRSCYRGHYSGLPAAWAELEAFVKGTGRTAASEFWERYVVNPNTEPDPEKWITELNWPLLG